MVFEEIVTFAQYSNILGIGIFLALVGLIFIIARAFTTNENELFQWMILLGTFGAIIMFRKQSETGIYFYYVVAILIIIYGFKYLRKEN